MRTILFFDDWVIQNYRGIERKWFTAQPWPGHKPATDPRLSASFGHPSILRDSDSGLWKLWAYGAAGTAKGTEQDLGHYHYHSEDGINWQPYNAGCSTGKAAVDPDAHRVFSGEAKVGGAAVLLDERDSDPARRYKMVYCDPVPDPPLPPKSTKPPSAMRPHNYV